jgi:tetratricopeptide (TPR) repeat protein
MKINKLNLIIILNFFLLNASIIYSSETITKRIEFGKNLISLHKFEEAIAEFDSVLKVDKNNPDALFNKSLCYFRLDQYDSSLASLNLLVKVAPKIADGYNLKGIVEIKKMDTNSAFNDFCKAIELDKNFAEAYLNRAKILIERGKIEDSYKDLLKANSLDTLNPEIYFQIARTEHSLGKYKDAIQHFTAAMENNFINSDIFLRRANSYFKNKEYKQAIDDYTQVIYWEPLNPFAYNNRAFAFDMIGDSLSARQDRRTVEDIRLGEILDPNKTALNIFTNKDSLFTISLPNDFKIHEENFKDSTVVYFYPDSIFTYDNRIGLKIKIIPFISRSIGSNETADIIEYWRKSQDSISTTPQFWRYQLAERVSKTYNNFPSILDKILMQKDKQSVATIIWNYGIAYGENLVEMRFIMPLPLYKYYSMIFQKTIESFKLKKVI